MEEKPPQNQPQSPVLGAVLAVAAIVFDERNRVLVIERKHDPGKGLWTVPGGKVEPGETLEQACLRELEEETGLSGTVGPLIATIERSGTSPKGPYNYQIHDFLVEASSFAIKAGTDASQAEFVSLDELASRPTTHGLEEVLHKALATHQKRIKGDSRAKS